MTRWPQSRRSELTHGECFEMYLSFPAVPLGAGFVRPPRMTDGQFRAFASRWHAARAQLMAEYPDHHEFADLDEVFGTGEVE
jgi:hypothetical protein